MDAPEALLVLPVWLLMLCELDAPLVAPAPVVSVEEGCEDCGAPAPVADELSVPVLEVPVVEGAVVFELVVSFVVAGCEYDGAVLL